MTAGGRIERDADHVLHTRTGRRLAHFGIATRGFVWGIVGGLATKMALGDGGKAVGTNEAIGEIAKIGLVPLIATAIGLLGYAAWRFAQAIGDEAGGHGKKRIWRRIGHFAVGVVHVGLAVTAAAIAMHLGSHGPQDRTVDWTAKLLHAPWGRALVAIAAAIAIGSAIAEVVQGIRAPFRDAFDRLSPGLRSAAILLGRFGSVARGVAFGAIGFFVARAAWDVNPNEAKGLGAALSSLRDAPFGTALFATVAIGLLAYAAFCLVLAPFAHLSEH